MPLGRRARLVRVPPVVVSTIVPTGEGAAWYEDEQRKIAAEAAAAEQAAAAQAAAEPAAEPSTTEPDLAADYIDWHSGGHYDGVDLEMLPAAICWSQAACPLLWVSADSAEAHFARERVSSENRRQRKFFYISLRLVQLAAASKLVGWCSHPACSSCEGDSPLGTVFQRQHYTQHSWTQLYSGGEAAVCERAQQLVSEMGGEHAVANLLNDMPASPQQDSVVVVRDDVKYVRAGSQLNGWAALLKHKGSSARFCTGCSRGKHSCEHLQLAAGGDLARHLFLSEKDFESKLLEDFDLETGERRPKCLSKRPLPFNWKTDSELQPILEGDGQSRTPVPPICSLSAAQLETPCPRCHKACWGAADYDDSRVFFSRAISETRFEKRCCERCCAQWLAVDGREYGLLRKRAALAFDLLLLYDWADRARLSHPDAWNTSAQLATIKLEWPDAAAARNFYQRYKQDFAALTLDFVQLMSVDYGASFRCECSKDGVTLDGMALAIHKDQGRVAKVSGQRS